MPPPLSPVAGDAAADQPCSSCNGTGRVPAIGADAYEGETEFCIWCYGSGKHLSKEDCDEDHWGDA